MTSIIHKPITSCSDRRDFQEHAGGTADRRGHPGAGRGRGGRHAPLSLLSIVLILIFLIPILPAARIVRPAEARGGAHAGIEQRRRDQHELEQRLARNPDDLEARTGLARVLADRGFFSEAVRQVDRVLDVDPGRPRDWRLRASFLLEKWREEGERTLLEEALDSFLRMAYGGQSHDGDRTRQSPSPAAAASVSTVMI